jgi:transposase-like protein
MYPKVEAWKQSGMKMADYAKSIGMTRTAFEYWVRKFRRAPKKADAGFVEIFPAATKGKYQEPSAQRAVDHSQGEIVFSFANGMSIKVRF